MFWILNFWTLQDNKYEHESKSTPLWDNNQWLTICRWCSTGCYLPQALVDRCSASCKAFGLTISTEKNEIIHQPQNKNNQCIIFQNHISEFMVAIWNIWKTSVVNSNASLDNEIVNQFSRATNVFGNWILVMEKPRDRSENKDSSIQSPYTHHSTVFIRGMDTLS